MSTTLEDRMILALREGAAAHGQGYWQFLQDITPISAQRWRKIYKRRQRPTPDMVEALCRNRPDYAFWIATGITDAENGHVAPETALTFPETPQAHRPHELLHGMALDYFTHSLVLLRRLYDAGRRAGVVDLADDESRLAALERIPAPGKKGWVNSELANHASAIAATKEYRDLDLMRFWREKCRADWKGATNDPMSGLQTPRELFWESGQIAE